MQRLIDVGDKVPQRGNAFSAWLGRLLLRLLGWRVTGELPDVRQAVIIGAPHTSNKDGIVAAAVILALRVRIEIMVKDNLFRWPIAGLLRWLGLIPVNRRSAHGLVYQSVAQFRQRPQLFLGMAPEGTRKQASKWKMGFYHIAQEAGLPIVVAVLDYGKKEARLALTLMPSGDEDADMARIMACYKGAKAARDERLSTPLKELKSGS